MIAISATTLLGAWFAWPVAAQQSPGNNGTIKIDDLPFDDHPHNEPHVGCTFQVDFYNYEQGDLFASATFELRPPTGDEVLLEDTGIFIGEDPAGGGTDIDASETYDLSSLLADIEPHPIQGWHIKLTVHADGSQGNDTKHKTFWVTGCPGPETGDLTLDKALTGDDAPPAGTDFSFTVSCDSGEVDSPVSINAAQPPQTVATDVLVGDTCTITETDDNGAASTTFEVTGGSVVSTTANSVTVEVTSTAVAIVVTNDFVARETRALTLDKVLTGAGAPSAQAAFTFTVSCDSGEVASPVTITAAQAPVTVATGVLVGDRCTITETSTGGAAATTFTVNGSPPVHGSSLTIVMGGDDQVVGVIATNSFAALVTTLPRTGSAAGWLVATGAVWLLGGAALFASTFVPSAPRRRRLS